MRWFLVIIAALLLAGCQSRETGKALVQADQGVQAGTYLLTGPEAKALMADSRMDADLRAEWMKRIDQAVGLFDQARASMAPGIALTGGGQPLQVDTTVEEAIKDPKAWHRKAQRQEARAAVETERLLWMQAIGRTAVEFGAVLATDWLSKLLLGAGGAGSVIATGLALFRRIATDAKVKGAMAEYSRDVEIAKTKDEVEAVKAKHAKRQKAAGIHAAVAVEVAKSKDKTADPGTGTGKKGPLA